MVNSPDSRIVYSGSKDTTIKCWRLDDSTCFLTLTGHTAPVRALAGSSDGIHLSSTSDDKAIRVWRPADNTCITTLAGHRHGLTTLALARDDAHLYSGSSDGYVHVWRLDKPRPTTPVRFCDCARAAVSAHLLPRSWKRLLTRRRHRSRVCRNSRRLATLPALVCRSLGFSPERMLNTSPFSRRPFSNVVQTAGNCRRPVHGQ